MIDRPLTDLADHLPRRHNTGTAVAAGFTLVEMMIAMAVTLILSAALATGFAYVGQSIKDGRGEVQLSNQLRDITDRLRDELRACTVSLDPDRQTPDQLGYFLYYEGPLTDATSSMFATDLDDVGELLLSKARYGDFDDYIAFTAVATGDNWFTGKVPRFLLDQRTAEATVETDAGFNAATDYYDPTAFAGNPWDPVVIRSKYAEIVYFASPEWDSASLPNNPRYTDTDGTNNFGSGAAIESGFPDRLRLHRRVLLIRPDLNMRHGTLRREAWNRNYDSDGDGVGVEYMLADAWPTAIVAPNALGTVKPGAAVGDAWLYGMGGVHQQCDLSLRRVLDGGTATQRVAANSLADLALPHNRFAHVRVPGNLIGLNASVTSMPVLALGPPATILAAIAASDGARLAPPPTGASASAIVTPTALSGFLRPEFVLGNDLMHVNNVGDSWCLERIGEDLIANNLIGFDVKVFDPQAVSVTTNQGFVVGSNDAGFRHALSTYIAGPAPARLMRGDFVDLAYPVLAGGALRGWGPIRLDRLSATNSPPIFTNAVTQQRAIGLLSTPFSGLAALGNAGNSYTQSLYRSGKVVTDGTGIRLFQPTFDTYTRYYETDGLIQGYVRPTFPIPPAIVIPPAIFGGGGVGTRWTTSNNANYVDWGSNGLDDNGLFGIDDPSERETLPPFLAKPTSIQIQIRLENLGNRQIKQASVLHRDAH